MPRVVPSQIVRLIDDTLSKTTTGIAGGIPALSGAQSAAISAVMDLLRDLPDEFIILNGDEYCDYRVSVNAVSDLPELWKIGNANMRQMVEGAKGLARIRDLLTKCPDQIPSPSTVELLFISDDDLRDSIRNDISAASRALSDGLWKAATVLAGAAAEAFLHWAITERKSAPDVEAARVAVIPSEAKDPDRWGLSAYIKVSKHLRLIDAETEKAADLAREFRNYIHPGRAARLAKVCHRGTALSALAAVEFIVRDLS